MLGGVVVVFPLPAQPQSDEAKAARELIQHVGKVVKDGLGGWSWDGVGLCLGVGELDDVDEWEDCCAEWGLEFVQVRSQTVAGRNEFGGTCTHGSFLFSLQGYGLTDKQRKPACPAPSRR